MALKRLRSSSPPANGVPSSSTHIQPSTAAFFSERDLDASSDLDQETDVVQFFLNGSKKRKILSSTVRAGSDATYSSTTPSSTRLPSSITISDGDHNIDRLSTLSDELLIRIIHLLPIDCVLICQSVSRRFHRLAGDAQVWKGLYWARWVRPRVRMLPGERERGRELFDFSSRQSKWLDEERLLRMGFDQKPWSAGGSGEEIRRGKDDSERIERPGHTVKGTNWKARYKLRHNWSIGAAEVREIGLGLKLTTSYEEVEEEMDDDSNKGDTTLMARLMDGGVITVDTKEGLRAWDLKRRECFAQSILASPDDNDLRLEGAPTCLCIDSGTNSGADTAMVVGYQDGRFEIWKLRSGVDDKNGTFSKQYRSRALKKDGMGVHQDMQLIAVAYAHPYLLTITAEHVLALYVFDEEQTVGGEPSLTLSNKEELKNSELPNLEVQEDLEQQLRDSKPMEPRLLSSLKSHTCWPPLCLSIRSTPQTVIASIAYALPTYLSGWSVGLQELHLAHSGVILRSRLASAIEQGFQSLLSSSAPSTPPLSQSLRPSTPGIGDSPDRSRSRFGGQTHPISLSYSHPYLLAGNRNNTLSLYLVTSNNEELKISKSTTLWGHTSSVSDAHVGGRGRAVSISTKADELRVWELEGGLGRKIVQERSVLVRRDVSANEAVGHRHGGSRGFDRETSAQRSRDRKNKGWVGFNDEAVIVLKEEGEAGQALVVYDFT